MENAERTDPTDPIERHEPTDPMQRTDPFEPIESNESSDHSDKVDLDGPAPVIPPSFRLAGLRTRSGAKIRRRWRGATAGVAQRRRSAGNSSFSAQSMNGPWESAPTWTRATWV